MELMNPRWREDPSYIEQMARQLRAVKGRTPRDIHEENLAKRREAEAGLPAALAEFGGASLVEQIRSDMLDAQALLPYREAGKHYLMMGYELIRLAIEELAERWDLGGRIYYLHVDELTDFKQNAQSLYAEIAKRRIRHQSMQRLDAADVIDSLDLDGLGLPEELEAASELSGAAMASGVATGTARIVFDPQKAGDLGTDYILTCPSTDPGWTPLFLHARGLVVERGGVLSHGAIVARDFGIPAVACKDATKLIPDGSTIRVDGNRGQITVVEE
jgi:pyruvate,water dikinase